MSALKLESFNQKTLSNPMIKVVKIKSKNGVEYFVKEKCNPSNLVARSMNDQKLYNIPYGMIVEALDDLPKGVKFKIEDNASNQKKYSNPSLKYVETKESSKTMYYLIQKCNPRTMSGRCIKTGKSYNIPYELIVKAHTVLPTDVRLTKDFTAALENEEKECDFSRESLKGFSAIKIMIEGALTELDIVKLNPKRVKAKSKNGFVIYDVPYKLVKEAVK